MIAAFSATLTLLFDAFLADDKVRDDHPAWPKIATEFLGTTNLHRRFLRVAMHRIEVPRAALVALLEADPDLRHTLQQETLPPTARRRVPLTVYVLAQAIPGVEGRPGEQLRKIDALACWPLADSAAVANTLCDLLHANPLRKTFFFELFDPVAHQALITAKVFSPRYSTFLFICHLIVWFSL